MVKPPFLRPTKRATEPALHGVELRKLSQAAKRRFGMVRRPMRHTRAKTIRHVEEPVRIVLLLPVLGRRTGAFGVVYGEHGGA